MTSTVETLETYVRDIEVLVTFDYCPAEHATHDCPIGSEASVELVSVVDECGVEVLGELDRGELAALERECLGHMTRWK